MGGGRVRTPQTSPVDHIAQKHEFPWVKGVRRSSTEPRKADPFLSKIPFCFANRQFLFVSMKVKQTRLILFCFTAKLSFLENYFKSTTGAKYICKAGSGKTLQRLVAERTAFFKA